MTRAIDKCIPVSTEEISQASGSIVSTVVGVYSTLPLHLPLEHLLQGVASTKPLLALLCFQVITPGV